MEVIRVLNQTRPAQRVSLSTSGYPWLSPTGQKLFLWHPKNTRNQAESRRKYKAVFKKKGWVLGGRNEVLVRVVAACEQMLFMV